MRILPNRKKGVKMALTKEQLSFVANEIDSQRAASGLPPIVRDSEGKPISLERLKETKKPARVSKATSIYISSELRDFARDLGKGNVSDGIKKALTFCKGFSDQLGK